MLDDLDDSKINHNDDSKEAELKISKKTRTLLKICKLAFNKPTYDAVIVHLIESYKKHEILKKKSVNPE